MQDFQFKTSDSDIVEQSWSLQDVKKQLGLESISLQQSKDKAGFFAVFVKADGTYKTMPVSKQMTAAEFATARLAKMKNPIAGSDGYVIVRANGTALATI